MNEIEERILRNQRIIMMTLSKDTSSKRAKRRLSEESIETTRILYPDKKKDEPCCDMDAIKLEEEGE